MAETFFGHWQVVVQLWHPHRIDGFVISGSDNADGFYAPAEDGPSDFEVFGAEWTITLQKRHPSQLAPWILWDAIRTTQFVAPEGLTVILRPQPDLAFGGTHMNLRCISLDPEINPIPTPNPFDFTIPGG